MHSGTKQTIKKIKMISNYSPIIPSSHLHFICAVNALTVSTAAFF